MCVLVSVPMAIKQRYNDAAGCWEAPGSCHAPGQLRLPVAAAANTIVWLWQQLSFSTPAPSQHPGQLP